MPTLSIICLSLGLAALVHAVLVWAGQPRAVRWSAAISAAFLLSLVLTGGSPSLGGFSAPLWYLLFCVVVIVARWMIGPAFVAERK